MWSSHLGVAYFFGSYGLISYPLLIICSNGSRFSHHNVFSVARFRHTRSYTFTMFSHSSTLAGNGAYFFGPNASIIICLCASHTLVALFILSYNERTVARHCSYLSRMGYLEGIYCYSVWRRHFFLSPIIWSSSNKCLYLVFGCNFFLSTFEGMSYSCGALVASPIRVFLYRLFVFHCLLQVFCVLNYMRLHMP